MRFSQTNARLVWGRWYQKSRTPGHQKLHEQMHLANVYGLISLTSTPIFVESRVRAATL